MTLPPSPAGGVNDPAAVAAPLDCQPVGTTPEQRAAALAYLTRRGALDLAEALGLT